MEESEARNGATLSFGSGSTSSLGVRRGLLRFRGSLAALRMSCRASPLRHEACSVRTEELRWQLPMAPRYSAAPTGKVPWKEMRCGALAPEAQRELVPDERHST